MSAPLHIEIEAGKTQLDSQPFCKRPIQIPVIDQRSYSAGGCNTAGVYCAKDSEFNAMLSRK